MTQHYQPFPPVTVDTSPAGLSIDTIRALFTYGIITFVIIGGMVMLFVRASQPDPSRAEHGPGRLHRCRPRVPDRTGSPDPDGASGSVRHGSVHGSDHGDHRGGCAYERSHRPGEHGRDRQEHGRHRGEYGLVPLTY